MRTCDVLIAGLGPVGAALAALLVREGVSVVAVEKDLEVYPLPRAAHFDHEIMRLFQQLGIASEVLKHARIAPAYEFRSAKSEVLLRFDLDQETSVSGWPQGFMFNQPGVERALRKLLADSPFAEVHLGRELVDFAEDTLGITATLAAPDGEEVVTARYLVGCDGASSTARKLCGIALHDYGFDEPWLVVDAVVSDGATLPDINLQICDPARPTTCVLMGPGRHRWEFMLKPGEITEEVLQDAFLRRLLQPWDCGNSIEIDRKAVYRFHGLVAKQWRKGHVLLAGDAAHQTPPFAGQGMCSGLRDAANLAWKLAAVLRGDAAEPLLDTYQVEREPHSRHFIELAVGMGRVVCTRDPNVAAERDAAMLAQRGAGTSRIPSLAPPSFAIGCILPDTEAAGSMFPQAVVKQNGRVLRLDDVMGAGAWLITHNAVAPPLKTPVPVRSVSLLNSDIAPFVKDLREWLDRHHAAAVLVRPDRYVFGTGAPAVLSKAFAGWSAQ